MKKLLLALTLAPILIGVAYSEPIEATVISIDADSQTFTLETKKAGENFEVETPLVVKVGPGDAQLPYEGKQIQGQLTQSDGKYLLEKIWPVVPEEEKIMNAVNTQLREDTAVRQRRQFRKEGDYGINFAMFNDHGKVVQWNQFKGKWIIMNFIFTRCRMPKMCPAQTARMIDLQRHAKEVGINNLHQLSITFDPVYDTPGILYDYATTRGADLSTFNFLTGKKDVMMDVLKQYGVIAFDSKNIIDHTVTTLLFDKTGKIVLRRDGTEWNENDFVQHILDAEEVHKATLQKKATEADDSTPAKEQDAVPSEVTDPDSSMTSTILLAVVLLVFIAAGVYFFSKRETQ